LDWRPIPGHEDANRAFKNQKFLFGFGAWIRPKSCASGWFLNGTYEHVIRFYLPVLERIVSIFVLRLYENAVADHIACFTGP
jgi:hypothetical protein